MGLLKRWWFWAIVVILALAIIYFGFLGIMASLFLRHGSVDFIRSEIDEANYCDVKEDCVNIGTKCPFGCDIYVNEGEADRIKELVYSYDGEDCIYDCYLCPGVECVNNSCVEVCGDGYFCGDGICLDDESVENCPEDCSDCLALGTVCYTENVQEPSCDDCCFGFYEIDPVCPEGMECATMYMEYLARCASSDPMGEG